MHVHQTITGLSTGQDLARALGDLLRRFPPGSSGLDNEARRAMHDLQKHWPREWCRAGEHATFTAWLRLVAPALRTHGLI